MQLPLQIVFHNVEKSEAIEARIREKAEKLERFVPEIMRCRVTVDAPHKHSHKGVQYSTRIDVTVPGGELVATHHTGKNPAHQDVYVSIRDAFDDIRRQLEDHVRKQRHKVKTHQPPPQGVIRELHPEEDYGIIETPDGREIYFHRNSVIDADFDRLQAGTAVRFHEEQGFKGPQASTVHVEG